MARSKSSLSHHQSMLAFFLVSFWLSILSSCAASTSSWNTAPLRIGIRAALTNQQSNRKKFQSALDKNSEVQEYWVDTREVSDSPSFDEAEWDALFQGEEENGFNKATYASRQTTAIRPGDTSEESRGFRQTLGMPDFSTRRNNQAHLVAYSSGYEDESTVPCAAISVSSKVPASFSSGLQKIHTSMPRRESTAKQRKNPTLSRVSQSKKANVNEKGRPLVFWENMICGAISRSVAQTIMHPANTMKTLLQQSNSQPIASYLKPSAFPVLFRGAGANFILSVPHGAVNFAVLETVRKELSKFVERNKINEEKFGPALDFMSSAISTICCSVVSTPQMMITDNIMAGNYNNLPDAIRGLASQGKGLQGFYSRGWLPGLVGKIPSYALTWTFFQQLKVGQKKLSGREATNLENTVMGCMASGTTVCIMIPLDTIKTRLVTQATKGGSVPYKGIVDCAVRVAREEGIKSFYKGLPPRLVSVVPMIGIQFTVYEAMKRVMQRRNLEQQQMLLKPALPSQKGVNGKKRSKEDDFDPYSSIEQLQESCMEVAASPEHPYPAPHFSRSKKRKKRQRWGWLRKVEH